ncbi:MAG TPA: response regulator [Verrucomicrobiae bacterium]
MSQRSILFVEDDADDALLLTHVCNRIGVEQFSFATNGKEAADFLHSKIQRGMISEAPLIFLDLNMPEMNGFEFLEWLRGKSEVYAMPVIVLSTSESPQDMKRAYALGANAYLVKSNALKELRETIAAAHTFWSKYNRVP